MLPRHCYGLSLPCHGSTMVNGSRMAVPRKLIERYDHATKAHGTHSVAMELSHCSAVPGPMAGPMALKLLHGERHGILKNVPARQWQCRGKSDGTATGHFHGNAMRAHGSSSKPMKAHEITCASMAGLRHCHGISWDHHDRAMKKHESPW